MSERVGIRELRQGLSRYLERVSRGERVVITDRNRPVAVLAPLPEHEDPWARLVAEGKLTPASRSFEDLPPPVRLAGPRLSESLEEVRREPWEDEPDR